MKVEPSRVVIASLLLATSARAQTAHVRDVTPDMGIVFQGFFSEGFALLGHRGVFASSANAGFRHSQNGGERWERAMSGYVDAAGTSPSVRYSRPLRLTSVSAEISMPPVPQVGS